MPALFVLLFMSGVALAQAPSEAEIKAAFVYNFIKFVEWPPQAHASKSSGVSVCALGKDALSSALPEIDGKAVRDKTIQVRQLGALSEAESCDVLYIARPQRNELPRILEAIRGGSILTIGDAADFAREGVMINFYVEKDQVRFEINPTAAKRGGLKISSSLLQLARIEGATS